MNVKKLREVMAKEGVSMYLINSTDPHQSEYISETFQTRKWVTGFTGSAGIALITQSEALLWTDGRYFIQAEKEIEKQGFKLMKEATPGYPSLLEWFQLHLQAKDCLGLNGWMFSVAYIEKLQKIVEAQGGTLKTNLSLAEDLWLDRPEMPSGEAFILEEKYSGAATEEKILRVKMGLTELKADYQLLSSLDDIAWLFNIRGSDVPDTPVILAYALIGKEEVKLFLDLDKANEEFFKEMEKNGVSLFEYEMILEELSSLKNNVIVVDEKKININLYHAISEKNQIIRQEDMTTLMKAIKNECEIRNIKEANLKDCVALSKFIFWLKETVQERTITELEASDYILKLRQQQSHFISPSFNTIAAYAGNAAMMHYAPQKEAQAEIEAQGFFLLDSGGQYLEGTTDITRTIAVGPLTAEEKMDYTLTLKAHIALARAIFLAGTPGYYLDALARQPLWQARQDYKSGTGHGVGYLLSVHEGPQRIARVANLVPLIPGMVVTDEPGVYKEGKHGIRIENNYVVVEDQKVGNDQFYCFEHLVYAPLEKDAILLELLESQELIWLNDYNAEVYAKLSPYLEEKERLWLAEITAAIS